MCVCVCVCVCLNGIPIFVSYSKSKPYLSIIYSCRTRVVLCLTSKTSRVSSSLIGCPIHTTKKSGLRILSIQAFPTCKIVLRQTIYPFFFCPCAQLSEIYDMMSISPHTPHTHTHIYIYIYIYWLGDPKAPFSIPTTPRSRGGRYFYPRIDPLTLDPYLITLGVKKGIKYHFLSL